MRFLADREVWHDERLGAWCMHADRRLAVVWLAAFVLVVVAFWTLWGWWLWGALVVVGGVAAALTVLAPRWEAPAWGLDLEGAELQLPGGPVPLADLTAVRVEPVVVLSMLKQPVGEATALVIEEGGRVHVLPTMAPRASVEALAATLRA